MSHDRKSPYTAGDWAAAGLLIFTLSVGAFRYFHPEMADGGIWRYLNEQRVNVVSGPP